MHNVDYVHVHESVYDDLEQFDPPEQERILEDDDSGIRKPESKVETWDADFRNYVTPLTTGSNETLYRQRIGKSDYRADYVRRADTLWCIGVGERDTTYERDLDVIVKRAETL
ncbi:hypothetical protein [Halorussus litoreus]|uniref:hypothetical protein n=1 Tax=Halorussus litoreus TaxID=1710536 RepID=UPI000E265D89|nr:hypothetical protein [Halorussus litoreus]